MFKGKKLRTRSSAERLPRGRGRWRSPVMVEGSRHLDGGCGVGIVCVSNPTVCKIGDQKKKKKAVAN